MGVDRGTRDRDSLRDLVMTTARGLRHRWFETLEPWQLSPHEVRALRVVARGGTGQDPRLGEIARELRIAPRSATEVIDRLEQRGLTESSPDDQDRRARCVRVTESGRRVLDELRHAQAVDADDFFAVLSDAERAQLGDILRRLTDAHDGEEHEHHRHGRGDRSDIKDADQHT
ncbi:MarR family winged helix-turn-helix transcriptional regulator [Gordonia otitidis]|uniref:MarR family winged helix-turn-helix transcriptional regulator n=1 Tax=Gordonia otitidis TaxID=249058 RepID=UPI0002FD78B0|nr:MarR family transcriptional regulator [Gordonia otitidis]